MVFHKKMTIYQLFGRDYRLLPGQMDILACGLLAAVVMQAGTVRWSP